jgi:hypothetical protein
MTPMTPKLHSGKFAATWLCSFVLVGTFLTAAGQSTSSSANAPPAPAPVPSEKQTDKTSADRAAPAQPEKKRKVITNEDLEAHRGRQDGDVAAGYKSVHAIPGTGACDDDCAEQARQIAGIGPEQEGQWQFQLAAARRNLAADTQWPGAYMELSGAVKTYCTFIRQQRAAPLPSGNDYMSQVERARRQKDAEDMQRALGQRVANAEGEINRLVQQASDEPVRAAIMQTLASRLDDSCD